MGGEAREFPPTRWTLVFSTRGTPESGRAAFDELLKLYWKPLYFYARRKGLEVEAAKDAVQGLFARLLEGDFSRNLDPEKGRFRGYLRASMDHHLANLHESRSALKRGGGAAILSLDCAGAERELAAEPPSGAEPAYDREWAVGVMERSLTLLKAEFEGGARRGPFDLFLRFFSADAAPSYEEAARGAGMTLSQLKSFLHRTRARFRGLVRSEVSRTLADPGDAESEIDTLARALGP